MGKHEYIPVLGLFHGNRIPNIHLIVKKVYGILMMTNNAIFKIKIVHILLAVLFIPFLFFADFPV